MWSAMEAEGTLYSKCISGKEPHYGRGEEGEAGMDGGLGVAGQSTQEHIIPPIVGVNYTKIHKTHHS